jgi:hypothetical protein
MMAGTVAPFEECLVLGWSGVMAGNIAVDKHVNDFRVGRRSFDSAMFVTSAKDVGLKSHGREFNRSAFRSTARKPMTDAASFRFGLPGFFLSRSGGAEINPDGGWRWKHPGICIWPDKIQ